VRFTLYAYSGGDFVGRGGSTDGCMKQFGIVKIGDHCADSLGAGQQLMGRGWFAVMFPAHHMFGPADAIPLGPGKYTLRGEVLWGDWRLRTNEVRVEIMIAVQPDDARASRLVDATFASFMCARPTMGVGSDLMGDGSVRSILEECPTSVHARLARSRLLVLQAERLSGRSGVSHDEQNGWKMQMLDVVRGIERHFESHPNDPLELDLLDGKVQLLRHLQEEEGLRESIDALIARYPESGRARRAEAMWRQLHSYPGDDE